MDPMVLGFYALLVVGSVCGLRAASQVGAMALRLARLESQLAALEGAPAARPLAAAPRPALAPASRAPLAARAVAADLPLLGAAASATAVEPPPPIVVSPLAPVAAPAAAHAAPTTALAQAAREAEWWHRLELRAGTRWITWLGAGALVIAAALFVKLAIDRGWLGPGPRIALGAAAGIGLLFAGWRAHRAQMRPLSHGLSGAGLGVLYVATYVAFASYSMVPRELALLAMIGVTLTGCVIAIRHDAQPIAALALLGGLLTPVAISSGDGSRDALCAYLIILDLGALALALTRRWRALELLALAGTWALFGGSLSAIRAPVHPPSALAWLAVFQALFAALPAVDHLRRGGAAAGPDRRGLAIANAAAAAACAAVILDGSERSQGAALLIMAAGYAALAAATRWLPAARATDPEGDAARLGDSVPIAAALATLGAPLLLRDHALVLAWSIEASLLLLLGLLDRRGGLRLAAAGVLALALLYGAAELWPRVRPGEQALLHPSFVGALLLPLGAWLFAWVHHVLRARAEARDQIHSAAALIVGGALLLALVHDELAQWLTLAGRRDLGDAAAPLVWAVGSLGALAAAARRRPIAPIRGAIALAALVAAGLCAVAYRAPAHPDALLALNLRFVAALVSSLALAANAAAAAGRDPDRARLAWAAALVGFGVAIGAEAYLHYSSADALAHAPRRAHTALSIAWSAYAATLLAVGFARRRRALRLGGLGLLGAVGAKLLLIDLAGAPQAYRVLSFLVVGALMIGVSFVYHRFERRQPPSER